MNLSIEIVIIIGGLIMGIGALVMSTRRTNGTGYVTQFDLTALRDRLTRAEVQIENLSKENLRLQAIVLWLRLQIEKHNVRIDPMPDYLREPGKFDALNIQFTDNGISINGSEVVARDIVGGDEVKRDEKNA